MVLWAQDNINRIEAQLQSVMVKNPKKSRPTCTKAFKLQQTTQTAGLEAVADASGAGEGTRADAGKEVAAEPQKAEQLDDVELEVWEVSDGEDDSLPALQDTAGVVAFNRVVHA